MPDVKVIDECCFSLSSLEMNGTALAIAEVDTTDGYSFIAAEACRLATAVLSSQGAILFRGFKDVNPVFLNRFASGFGSSLSTYEYASTPRTEVSSNVYSSTEYPAHQRIDMHNEQSYTSIWPRLIWFCCSVVAESGGETPIADSRIVVERLDARIRERFSKAGVMYVRNYGNGIDLPWQKVFNTDDRAVVEKLCASRGITCEWRENGSMLRTREICPAVIRHPDSGQRVWFNQAHLFHISSLDPEIRNLFLEIAPEDELPRNAYFGDGSRIDDSIVDEIRDVYRQSKLTFPWRRGDVLMLDNILMAHGREPFTGARNVFVAMA